MTIRSRIPKFAVVALLGIAMSGCAWVTRASVDSSGNEGTRDSLFPSVSGDGRYVAFQSLAADLVAGDANNVTDVFLRDTEAGTTSRVSVDSDELEADGGSSLPAVSADGRYVAFESDASNLVPGDTNGEADVFVRDTVAGTTSRVSVDTAENQANGSSAHPSVSADGRYVTFDSFASNLIGGDTNNTTDTFVRDTVAGTTSHVSVDSAEVQGNSSSSMPSISGDGRYIAFHSTATNLVAVDTNNSVDIFVRDTIAGTTIRASLGVAGAQANNHSFAPSISADGDHVAFETIASNLVVGDTNGSIDVFVRDLIAGSTSRASVDSAGNQTPAASPSFDASISTDGRYVAYRSFASNLVSDDTNGVQDVFVRDNVAATTVRVSVDTIGEQADDESEHPSISADGRYVAFDSEASNMVSDDTNDDLDVFVRANPQPVVTGIEPAQLAPGTTTAVTVTGSGFIDGAYPFVLLGGGGVSFSSVTVASPTEIVADATVAAGATLGPRHVGVLLLGTGAGGATGICLGCLTIG